MTKPKIVLILLLCFSAGGLTHMMPFQSCILARDSGRPEEMSEEQRKMEVKRRLQELKRQDELREELRHQRWRQERRREIAKRWPERAQKRKPLWTQSDQRRKEYEKEIEKAGVIACHVAKIALGESEERWKLIQPKLEKVQDLRDQATSTVGAGVSDGSSDSRTGPSGPALQWKRPWKYTPLFEMTEAQKLARQIRTLLEKKDTPPQAFRRNMADLRKARRKEAEIERQLAEARRELREILTTRQEAILVLLGWL